MQLFVQIHAQPHSELPQTFEGLAEAIGSLPGMYFEMDGSFVWVDRSTDPPSQMDGMVYDRNGRLEYVEVKGACNATQWRILCQAICNFSPNARHGDVARLNESLRIHRVSDGDWKSVEEIASMLLGEPSQQS